MMWQDFCTEVPIVVLFAIAAEALMEAMAPGSDQALWGQSFANNVHFEREAYTQDGNQFSNFPSEKTPRDLYSIRSNNVSAGDEELTCSNYPTKWVDRGRTPSSNVATSLLPSPDPFRWLDARCVGTVFPKIRGGEGVWMKSV